MIQHYFNLNANDFAKDLMDRLHFLFERENFIVTPAEMENHAVASSTVEELLERLEKIVAHPAA